MSVWDGATIAQGCPNSSFNYVEVPRKAIGRLYDDLCSLVWSVATHSTKPRMMMRTDEFNGNWKQQFRLCRFAENAFARDVAPEKVRMRIGIQKAGRLASGRQ